MSTTGDIIAGTGTSVVRSTATAWTNPGNITANDNSTASCASNSVGSAYLRASNFNFGIPTNSLIQGFTVKVEMAESSTGTETVRVQIVGPAGTAIGTAKTFVASGTTLTLYTTGSSTDLWGTTGLTAADVNDTDFGVYVWYTTTHSTTVDYISIDVNYEPPRTGTLAATESGSDTAAINGTVSASGVTGSLAATEVGTDTASINGDVVVKGSLTAAESGNDVSVVFGKVLVQGSLNASETGADVAAIAGQVRVYGSLLADELGADTASLSGKVFVAGTFAVTEVDDDTASITGQQVTTTTGSIAVTEIGTDTANLSGNVLIQGSFAVTEGGNDVASFVSQAIPSITGSMSAFEGFGIGAATRVDIVTRQIIRLTGQTGAVIIADDVPTAPLPVGQPNTGSMAATESIGTGNHTRVEINSGRVVKLIGDTGAYLT